MKRSMTVSLVLMGSAALGLTGCKPKAESYPSVEACEAAGQHTDQECRDGFAAAQREHEASARHYQTREECVAAYGSDGCEERHAEGGGSFFMPLMLGYMLGGGFGYHPLYQDPIRRDCVVGAGGMRFGGCSSGGSFAGGGGATSGSWYRGSSGFGGSSSPSSSSSSSGSASETSTVSRGGFGASGHGSSGGE
jgi:uncharacterized protein YgiB involved in biofilm formation